MLAHLVPGPLVRVFASRYMAGGSIDDGVAKARALLDDHLVLSTMDLLGEAITDPRDVEHNVRTYVELIDRLAADRRFRRSGYRPRGPAFPSVSVKPTAFTVGAMEEATGPITQIVEHAASRGIAVTIDMEDHRYTDYTIDLAVSFFERGFDVGTVLQSRLFRTKDDLARIPEGMRVRLVIGIYPEPGSIALTDKREMKALLIEFAQILLDRGVYVEFATHDERTLRRFLNEVAPSAPDRCEIQMLLGVPREAFVREMRAGAFGAELPVRLYVPFAVSWDDATAYLRRRMEESPNMIWLVLRNLLPSRR